MAARHLIDDDLKIILAYADANMNATQAAKLVFYCRETLYDHLATIYLVTGLNPRNFYDLIELIKRVKEGKLVAIKQR